ncbi:hypothetical protein HDU97_005419 [Phlyctochytrium planicorne]|nr:hypothetical protein HDU97_005419 [Phlyctochytrium planicorne]
MKAWYRWASTKTATFYDILGIKSDAKAPEIKSQFYALSKRFHPDMNPGDESAHETFIRINEAYSTLSNESLRREYDRSLELNQSSKSYPRGGWGGGSGPRPTSYRATKLRPDDWVFHRPPKGAPGANGSYYDYEAHQKSHYESGQNVYQNQHINIHRVIRRERKAADGMQANLLGRVMLLGVAIFLFLQSGMVKLLFMEDEVWREDDDENKTSLISGDGIRSLTISPGFYLNLRISSSSGESGTTVWKSGMALASFLAQKARNGKKYLEGKKIVDLGTGSGLVGITAAHLGGVVFLTDVPSVIEGGNIRLNISLNPITCGEGSMKPLILDWGEEGGDTKYSLEEIDSCDIVTGADITYCAEAITPLIQTISKLKPSQVLITTEKRDPIVFDKFLEGMATAGFRQRKAGGGGRKGKKSGEIFFLSFVPVANES